MKQELGTVTSEQSSMVLTNQKKKAIPPVTWLVLVICWFAMFAEGYDLGIYGAVLPALMEYKAWSLSAAQAGAIGSYALMGMLVGAIIVGTVTDLIGRKKVLIFCITLFSIMMFLASLAPSAELFGLYRFIAGLGCGGIIPTASALTIEYAPAKYRSMMYAIMYTGYCIGGSFGALLSMYFLEEHGWRTMIMIGALPIIALPFIIKFLPESIDFLVVKRKYAEAEKIAQRFKLSIEPLKEKQAKEQQENQEEKHTFSAVTTLFAKQNIRATVFFWITFFMGLFMIYGLSTWLPKMMREAGYPLGSSISFLLVLNFSAAVGALLAGAAADRWGSKKVIFISYLLAGISIALLSAKPSSILAVYSLIGIAGIGTIGTTLILNAYISKYFPAENRATALGWALGFGRIGAIIGPILGGLFLTWKLDLSWNFYVFASAAILASICVLFIPQKNGEKV